MLLLAFEAKDHQNHGVHVRLRAKDTPGANVRAQGSNALAVALCTNTFYGIFCRSNTGTHTRTLFFRHRLALECANISKGIHHTGRAEVGQSALRLQLAQGALAWCEQNIYWVHASAI